MKILLVETEYESALYLHAELLYLPDARSQIASPVWNLLALFQAFFIRRLDAYKDRIEPGAHHKSHQFIVIRRIERSFCVEIEGISERC